jgi:hypothetical protein
MSQRNSIFVLSLLLAGAPAGADSGAIGGLVSGVVFDGPSRTVRPLIGAPGAGYLGPAVLRGLDAFSVAPGGRQAVAVVNGHLYWVSDPLAETPVWLLVAQEVNRPELVAWRNDSGAAAVSSGGGLLLVSPTVSTVAFPVEALGGKISALAMAGNSILAGVEGMGLYRLEEGAPPSLLAQLANPAGIAIAGEGRLYVADRTRGEILEVRNYLETPEVFLFAGGVADPVALSLSRRGTALLAAGASSKKVTAFDLASGALLGEFDLDFEPSRLDALGDGSSFLLNGRVLETDTLEVFVEGLSPGVYFVPAPAAESVSGEE